MLVIRNEHGNLNSQKETISTDVNAIDLRFADDNVLQKLLYNKSNLFIKFFANNIVVLFSLIN